MQGAGTLSISAGPPGVRRHLARAPQIVVVDDDLEGWAGLICLLERMGLTAEVSPRIPESLLVGRPDTPMCLIMDINPGRDGLQFQQRLAEARVFVPIIFVAESGDISKSVKAMKNGAVDFLSKPFRNEELLEAIEIGLGRDQAWCAERRSLSTLRSRFETLSQRERQVMGGIVKGKLNKQVAFDLGISEITVKAHRGRVMRKMNAMSLVDLARIADKIAPSCPPSDNGYIAATGGQLRSGQEGHDYCSRDKSASACLTLGAENPSVRRLYNGANSPRASATLP